MNWREKIQKITKILENKGMIQSNQLVNYIENSGIMARQTAYDTIDEAVKTGKIIRIEKPKGKTTAIFYTVHSDFEETEKFFLNEMERLLIQFDQKFCIFKNDISTLSVEKKSQEFQLFSEFLSNLNIVTGQLWANYEKTRKWSLIKSEVTDRHHQMDKLLKTMPKKERLYVGRYILEERLLHLNDMMKKPTS